MMHSAKKTSIIFCQAPADVKYVLGIYEKELKKSNIQIYVLNSVHIYNFINSLNLSANVRFIPPIDLDIKKFSKIIKARKEINKIWQKKIFKINVNHVYFFSCYEDLLTASLVSRLSQLQSIKVYYCDHYDDMAERFTKKSNYSLKAIIYRSFFRLVTGAKFNAKIREKLPEFCWQKYAIKKMSPLMPKTLKKYLHIIKKTQKNQIIFFESPKNNNFFIAVSYEQKLHQILTAIKNLGYHIILKSHPRTGSLLSFTDIFSFEIPSYIPADFLKINEQEIDFCLGINSYALCNVVKQSSVPVYSIIDLMPQKKDANLVAIKKILQDLSENKIQFPANMQQFINNISIEKLRNTDNE